MTCVLTKLGAVTVLTNIQGPVSFICTYVQYMHTRIQLLTEEFFTILIYPYLEVIAILCRALPCYPIFSRTSQLIPSQLLYILVVF